MAMARARAAAWRWRNRRPPGAWESLAWVLAVMAAGVGGATAGADDGPRVRSKASAEASGEGLGRDYSPDAVDGSRLSPWEQAEFFGVRAKGRFFVYVVDCSGSMADGRLLRAKLELRRSIARLGHPQRFLVIFYNDRPMAMPGGIPSAAGPDGLDRLDRWLRRIDAEGPTDPREAVRMALGYRPSAVYLLSDGEFPGGSVEAIAAMNPGTIPIHCVALGDSAGVENLRRIAERSGGRFVRR